ncbi:MAG: hypothetical protein HYX24_06435 [Candidatus Aenigmarchaeota archaeon]|nr:hypothetical protein [Candidatus Aenigmarchaeota archaeon]
MNRETHKRNIMESVEVIRECIDKGVEKRQRTIGFHCSSAATDMLELFLHENNLIDPGANIKHDYFSSIRKAEEKLNFEFPNKQKIIKLLVEIENKRNLLCYGKPQEKEEIEKYIELFNTSKSVFEKAGIRYE